MKPLRLSRATKCRGSDGLFGCDFRALVNDHCLSGDDERCLSSVARTDLIKQDFLSKWVTKPKDRRIRLKSVFAKKINENKLSRTQREMSNNLFVFLCFCFDFDFWLQHLNRLTHSAHSSTANTFRIAVTSYRERGPPVDYHPSRSLTRTSCI